MLGTAAKQRKESRGGHFRIDYPNQDNKNFLGNFILSLKNGKLNCELKPVPDLSNISDPPSGAISTSARLT